MIITYTHATLALFGLLGVLLHTLVELNGLKKANPNGDVDYIKYFKMEWISILISVIVVGLLVWTSQEVTELANAGKWLGIGFIASGYLAQSLLIKFMGRAQNIIDNELNKK